MNSSSPLMNKTLLFHNKEEELPIYMIICFFYIQLAN